MNGKILKGALFDLDGVVFDTEPQYSVFWGDRFKEYYPESNGMEKLIKGQTLIEIYERFFPNKPTQEEITRKLNAFEQDMRLEYVMGFEKFVTELKSQGVRTAVVTSSNKMKMNNVYAKRPEFKDYFDAVLTAEDFSESKPSPDCYLKAAKRFRLTTEECIVFEDSFNGLKSGRAADMFVVGLSTTNPAEKIKDMSDLVIADYKSLDYNALQREFKKSSKTI